MSISSRRTRPRRYDINIRNPTPFRVGTERICMHPTFTLPVSFRVAAVASLLFLPGAGSGAEKRPGKASGTATQKSTGAATASVPDACSFIPKLELERLIGWELRDGKRKDMSPGLSQCDFATPPQAYVTRRYENPVLPEAAGFSSVVITTFPTTPETFSENRRVMPGGVRDIPNLADDAFTYGPAMIYVRAGNRGFSIRVHVNEPKTEPGKVILFDLLVGLARTGIARL